MRRSFVIALAAATLAAGLVASGTAEAARLRLRSSSGPKIETAPHVPAAASQPRRGTVVVVPGMRGGGQAEPEPRRQLPPLRIGAPSEPAVQTLAAPARSSTGIQVPMIGQAAASEPAKAPGFQMLN